MSIPGMPPGPIPGTPGSPEWAAQQMAHEVAQRSSLWSRRVTTSSVAGVDDGAHDVNIHIVPTKGQARARLIIGVAMAVMFVLFVVVFVIVAIHIFHGSSNPGIGN
jgi:hypothetical protein